jgi:hypothetical protein
VSSSSLSSVVVVVVVVVVGRCWLLYVSHDVTLAVINKHIISNQFI